MKTGDRVKDLNGFTGTITDMWEEFEVTWDISGCTSDCTIMDIKEMKPGDDDPLKQKLIHETVFNTITDKDIGIN